MGEYRKDVLQMLSVIIAAQAEPALLARTLSSVVPAIPEGIVRDGWIIDTSTDADIAAIADGAGCALETGSKLELLPVIAQKCASDWLLMLDAGVALEEGWWREVAEYMESLATGQNGDIDAAGFVHASQKYGAWPRIVEHALAAASYIPFISLHKNALIAKRHSIVGRKIQAFPPRVRGKSITFRAKAITPA